MNYINIIEGDLEKTTLGSFTDCEWLIENVNFIFHCAATVRFNEPLELAAKVNIQGTANLLTLATQMKNLKVTYNNRKPNGNYYCFKISIYSCVLRNDVNLIVTH